MLFASEYTATNDVLCRLYQFHHFSEFSFSIQNFFHQFIKTLISQFSYILVLYPQIVLFVTSVSIPLCFTLLLNYIAFLKRYGLQFFQYLSAPTEKLSHRTYNVAGYSFSPEEIAAAIRKLMSNFEIEYEVCPTKQKIGW